MEDERDFEDVVWNAMREAHTKFREVLEEDNFEPRFADVEWTVFILDREFDRLKRIEYEDEYRE